jgi:hypothetical protein
VAILVFGGLGASALQIGRNSGSEALSCYEEALQLCPIGHPGRRRLLSGMSKCFLDPSSPSFSLSKGISCLSQAYAITSNVSGRLKSAASDLQDLEVAYSASKTGSHAGTHTEDDERILNLYAQIIGLLPLAANFGLDHGARLQAVTGSDEIARNAAARAMIFGRFPQAVELLEQGRGVFWTQTLHLRTTTFDGVPENDCQELQRMLRLLERDARRVKNMEQTVAQRERELESRRQLNETVQALISKIRGYAGLDRFLLPPAFDALLGCLPDGFVALVNASKLGHHALLLHGPTGLATGLTLKPLRVGFDCAQLRAQLPRDVMSVSRQGSEDKRRAMRINCGKSRGFEAVLSLLWITIVQPIFDALGLKVSCTFIVASLRISDRSTPENARARSTSTLVVCNGRPRLFAYSCCRELLQPEPGVHCRLRHLFIYPYARLTHQGRKVLDAYHTQQTGWTSHLRDIDNRGLSGIPLQRSGRSDRCSRVLYICRRACFESAGGAHSVSHGEDL